MIRRLWPWLAAVAVVDEHGPASGGLAGCDVAPAVADHPAFRKHDAVFLRRLDQQSRLGLPARAIIGLGVPADPYVVDPERIPHLRMHRADKRWRSTRLIRRDDHEIACSPESLDRIAHARQDDEIFELRWPDRTAVA